MAEESRGRRISSRLQTVRLGRGLEKSLSAYVSAAMAAGVGLLAMAECAEGKVVYTSADANISVNNGSLLLDLNHDGFADFAFWNQSSEGRARELGVLVGCSAHQMGRSTSTCNYRSNMVWGRGIVSGRFASALPAGFAVGANKAYFQQGLLRQASNVRSPVAEMAGFGGSLYFYSRTSGQWINTKRRYLGLQFVINGQVHYGWARLNVTLTPSLPRNHGFSAILTGYAYDTIPNKPIITGKTEGPDVITVEPASLGQLARGASGVSAWRERK